MNNIYAMCDNFSYLYSLPFSSIFNNSLYKNDNKNYVNINEEFHFLIINKLSHLLKSNKKNYHTLDELDKRNDNEILEFLKEKAPQIFKDGKLDLEAFKLAANLSNQEDDLTEKYGLNWKGKTNSIWNANQKSDKTLIPQRDKSMNFDQSNNIIIEGDNLDVLKTLQASYANKVDVIYIDPPYNTGNDFIYNDDFHQTSNEYKSENNLIDEEGLKTTTNQKTDGRFHTNWLNMMYPRLMLARKLLKEDGVIFISIDDDEQAHLKMLCDEIFGEHNFVGCWIRLKSTQGKNDSREPVSKHDYLIIYSKNKSLVAWNKKDIDQKYYTFDDKDGRGPYHLKNYISATEGLGYVESLDFEIEINGKNYVPISKNKRTRWIWDKDRIEAAKKLNILVPKGKLIYSKKYLNWSFDENNELIEKKSKVHFDSLNLLENFYSNKQGTKDSELVFGKKIFNYPKPISLCNYLFNMIDNKNALVLDFFAGSGTTGQAVMDLNKEDGGNRQFILVQLPELIENNNDQFKTISDITRERIKRSIEKYGYKEKGFKFFKLDESNLKSTNWTNQNSYQEFQQSLLDLSKKVKSNRSAEDVAYEIVLRAGLPFDKNLHQIEINNNLIFIDDSKSHIFILEPTKNSKYYENIIDVVKEFAKDIAGGLNIYLNDQYFKNDEAKINFVEQVKSISEQIKVWVI